MRTRLDTLSAEVPDKVVTKKKRTRKPPLWHRIIFDDAMVALVRLLGHDGVRRSELPDKAKPLIEKFGRERLQEVADEIVEIIGDGNDEIARLTEQARKLAVQLIGRPRAENLAAGTANISETSSASSESTAIEPMTEARSMSTPIEAVMPTIAATLPAPPCETVSAKVPAEDSPATDQQQMDDDAQDWTNYETSCVADFLNQDGDFAGECFHLAEVCCHQAAQRESVNAGTQTESQVRILLLAEHLQSLVCEHNPFAVEDVSPFTELLEAALNQVDWQQLAESFLRRSANASETD